MKLSDLLTSIDRLIKEKGDIEVFEASIKLSGSTILIEAGYTLYPDGCDQEGGEE